MIRSNVKALIDRFLDGKPDPAAGQLLEDWLDILAADASWPGNPLNRRSKERLRKRMLATVRERTGNAPRVRHLWRNVAAAACMLGVLGLGYYMIHRDKVIVYQELRTAIGEKKLLLLPDSSKVWLGANSILKYAVPFAANRSIQLISGEAFFEVAPLTKRPFTVDTDSLRVLVLGTSFNIRAYGEQLELAVSSGKVKVSKGAQVLDVLTAREALIVDRAGYKTQHKIIDPAYIGGWKNNQIIFDDMPVATVLALLENYYPVKFIVRKLPARRISGSFQTRLRVPQIIRVLEELTDHQVIIKPAGAGIYTVE
ncbi:FecR domain-containing protein [Chitinophaga sp. MM2321]|uniref:FecR family protein n=1 Tax=Chitinophaga sp. MM2321 TaxID=3137178 RepID=UPI0032D59B99